jgi:hypothetical protein
MEGVDPITEKEVERQEEETEDGYVLKGLETGILVEGL